MDCFCLAGKWDVVPVELVNCSIGGYDEDYVLVYDVSFLQNSFGVLFNFLALWRVAQMHFYWLGLTTKFLIVLLEVFIQLICSDTR